MNKMTLSIVGFLFLATIVSAYPSLPYTDLKNEQKDVQLSEEAVAAYLKDKMDKENLEPASIMKYVVALLEGSSKKTTKDEDECVPEARRTTESLKKVELQRILDTIYPVTGNPAVYTNFITPNHGVTMYVHETDPLTTYQQMLNSYSNSLNDIDIIWANFAPCPSCARTLIARYNKDELQNEKPTIYIARLVDYTQTEQNVSHVIQSLECLAKLKHEGFKIEAWNYETFKTYNGGDAFVTTCNTVLEDYNDDGNFTEALSDLVRHVSFAQQLGDVANSWCTA